MEHNFLPTRLSSFTNPRQERIYRRLQNLVGSGPSLFYKDACQLMRLDKPLPSTTHLVAHLLREIESALCDVLEPIISKKAINPKSADKHKEKIIAILSALEISAEDAITVAWLGVAGKQNPKALHSRAHRNALASPRPVDSDFQQFWFDMEKILDDVLNRFEANYLAIHSQLDALRLKNDPTREDAKILKNSIPNNIVAFNYFFSELNNPAWLEPLWAEGLFAYPPQPIQNEEEGTISYPLWPQSRYLISTAPLAPELVSEIALDIETDNAYIQADLVDAACQLPPILAAKHAKKISRWVKNSSFLLGDKIGNLVSHLAKANEITAAEILTKEVLTLEPGNRLKGSAKTDETLPFPIEPFSRVNSWEYQEFLRHHYPDFMRAAPREALTLITNTLEEALRLHGYSQAEEFRDYSEIWRPAIEDHPQNRGHGEPREALVYAVRDTATYYVKREPEKLGKIVEVLEAKRWTVFWRIALYLTNLYGNENTQLVEDHILNRNLFNYAPGHHEYSQLVF